MTARLLHGRFRARTKALAFSLMELMLSVALLAVIITALLLVFEQTQRAFRGGNNQTDVLEGGRAATQLLSRELQELTSAGLTNIVDLLVYTPSGSVPLRQELPGGGERANELQRLTFLTRTGDRWAVTAYQVDTNQGVGVGGLYRWSTNVVFNDLGPALRSAISWRPNAMVDSRVIDGVIHFSFQTFFTNGVLIPTRPLAVAASVNGTGCAFPTNFVVNPTNNMPALPSAIELELGILEPQTLANYRARPGIANYLYERIGRTHLFRQRIPIRTSEAANSLASTP